MSGGPVCRCGAGKKSWSVLQRMCNHSKFNGRRYTPSDYSAILCSACGAVWRTKASYVNELPDHSEKP